MILLLKRTAICVLVLSSVTSFCQRKPAKPAEVPGPLPATHLLVDATHAPQKILHAQLQIPALPGNFTLVYPKWIPGEHWPTGPVVDLTRLQVFGNVQRLSWHRDLNDMHAFVLAHPEGGEILERRLDPFRHVRLV